VLIGVALVFLVPAYIVAVNAFKLQADVVADPLGWPLERMTLANFQRALDHPSFDVADALLFSTGLTVVVTAAAIACGAGLAYYVARRGGRLGAALYLLLLAGLMVPPQVVVIPTVKILDAIGLLFTPAGLVLTDVAQLLPLTAFVYVPFVRTVPRDLEEAAAVDGAGPVRIFGRITFPLMAPATATLAVLLSIFTWNDFLTPQILLGPGGSYTITTGLFRAIGLRSTDWGLVYAFVILAAAPMLLLAFVFQRRIVGGLTAGAVKR
jgi:raffinose/stachyose/melibiose transport system permease protein